jgi:uncharacterized protein with PIN domain
VLDSSVLVGMIRGEPDTSPLLDLLDSDERAIGAPSLVETRLWCSVNLATRSSEWSRTLRRCGPGNNYSVRPGDGGCRI